jgi:hypothetical protein
VTEQEARRRADEQKAAHQVPADWGAGPAEPRWIELAESARDVPSPVRDVRAWIVRYRTQLQWVDLAVDDATGQVVRVERSR